MKYIKLFLISVVVFGVMLFCISLLFPTTTIVSRAVNVKGDKMAIKKRLPEFYRVAFSDSASFKNAAAELAAKMTSNGSDPVSSGFLPGAKDTLLFISPFATHIQQGIAVYQLPNDSTAVQVFYKIQVPTYKFWNKFGLMLNEAKYGPSLDSATRRIAAAF